MCLSPGIILMSKLQNLSYECLYRFLLRKIQRVSQNYGKRLKRIGHIQRSPFKIQWYDKIMPLKPAWSSSMKKNWERNSIPHSRNAPRIRIHHRIFSIWLQMRRRVQRIRGVLEPSLAVVHMPHPYSMAARTFRGGWEMCFHCVLRRERK